MEIVKIRLERARKEGWFGGYHNAKPIFVRNGIDCEGYKYVYAEITEKGKIYIANPFTVEKKVKIENENNEVVFIKNYLDGRKEKIKTDLRKGKVFINYFPEGAVNVSYRFTNPIENKEDCEVLEVCSASKTLHNKIKMIKEKYHDFEGAQEILSWYEDYKKKVNSIFLNKEIIRKIERAERLEEKLRKMHILEIRSEKGDECIEISPYKEGLIYRKYEEREIIQTDRRTLFGEPTGKTYIYKEKKEGWWDVSADEISAELRNNPEVKKLARINARYFRVKRYKEQLLKQLGGKEVWDLWQKIKDAEDPKKRLPSEWWSEIKNLIG